MSFNYSKLEGLIKEVCGTQAAFANRIGLSERTISLKLSGKTPWKQPQIKRACEILKIKEKDIPSYFFATRVQ